MAGNAEEEEEEEEDNCVFTYTLARSLHAFHPESVVLTNVLISIAVK